MATLPNGSVAGSRSCARLADRLAPADPNDLVSVGAVKKIWLNKHPTFGLAASASEAYGLMAMRIMRLSLVDGGLGSVGPFAMM